MKRAREFPPWLLVGSIGLSAFTPSCSSGGQTGEEGGARCQESRTELALDEDSPLGFSGADVLALAPGPGEVSLPLVWRTTSELSYGPESGVSALKLSLEELGSVDYVDSELSASTGEILLTCTDRVEIAVELGLFSSGGAIAERLETKLSAATRDAGLVFDALELETLAGSLKVTPSAGSTTNLSIEAQFETEGVRGMLAVGVEEMSGDIVGFRHVPVACFGQRATMDSCEE